MDREMSWAEVLAAGRVWSFTDRDLIVGEFVVAGPHPDRYPSRVMLQQDGGEPFATWPDWCWRTRAEAIDRALQVAKIRVLARTRELVEEHGHMVRLQALAAETPAKPEAAADDDSDFERLPARVLQSGSTHDHLEPAAVLLADSPLHGVRS